jgi:hypothetical protein
MDLIKPRGGMEMVAPGLAPTASGIGGVPGDLRLIPEDGFGGPATGTLGPLGLPGNLAAPGVATQPAAAVATRPMSKDAVYLAAMQKFRDADYRGCIDDVKNTIEDGRASLEIRQLHIAALVATEQVSLAAFRAVQGAKAYPKTFFVDRLLAGVYRDQPDFVAHFESVKTFCKEPTTLEPGILLALYQQLQGADDTEVAVTLDLLHPKSEDRTWFGELLGTVKHKPAATRPAGK